MPLEDIVRKLEAHIEPVKWFRISRDHKPLQGEVSREGFKITRLPEFFLPIIRGTFKLGQPGVKVIIRNGLHAFVTAFMCVWFSGVCLGILERQDNCGRQIGFP